MKNPESLKKEAWRKCLICRQVRHWAKECPNHEKPPKTDWYKCLQLVHWAALYPWHPRASRSSTKPSLMMVQQDLIGPLQPACLSQITITGPGPRVQLDVQVAVRISWLTQGLPILSWPPTLEFSCQTCTILGTLGQTTTKDSPKHFFIAGMNKHFPASSGGPWVSYTLIGKRSFLPLKSCSYFSPDRRCFKTFSWGQAIFPSQKVKQLLNGRGHLWMSDQRVLRYQVVLMENLGLTISTCELLNPATLLPTPEGSFLSLLPRNFGPLDKTPWGIVRRSSDQSWGNMVHWWKQICLGWKKKSWICSSLQFWDHRG